ncbi:MAG: 3-isopropylmalate dehydratase small subunit [Reyranellaceae bacterium]
MDKFTRLEGVAAPFLRQNVDTDMIIPMARLVGTTREDIESYGFELFRLNKDGSEKPDFVLNQPAWKRAPILLAGDNFGCGSSREAAVWALWGMGVRAVIAPSFGDIFYNNCFQNGLLPVELPIEEIEKLAEEMQASPGNARVTIDLERQVVVSPRGRELPFKVEANRRNALLQGLDDIGVTMTHQAQIEAWQARDHAARPWVWLGG